jgi:[protein-PII] uridylyltransferase
VDNIKAEIEALLYENAQSFEIAKVIKNDIKTYFNTLEDTFTNSGGKDFLVKHTKKIDQVLQLIYKVALREMFGDYAPMKNSIPISLAALGSYGREQLCVYSDIDLMIVYKDVPGFNTKEMIEKILYLLWDTGLKLGHRVHTVEELLEVSKTDITIKTAIIESRFIEGSHFVWVETQNAIDRIRHDNLKEYITLKLVEQKHKHEKFPLTMEPNLKEGVGGFRDANLVYWIGKLFYNVNHIKDLPHEIVTEKEYRPFRIALEFLFRVRSALHLATHKKEDKLRLDLIPGVASLLGYNETKEDHMKLAKKVTESLKIIRLYSTIWLDKLTYEHLTTDPNANYVYPTERTFNGLLKQLNDHAQAPFTAHPTFMQKLITVEHPERLDETLYQTIEKIFYQPYSYAILTVLSDTRLLKYVIPPMKKVVDLPQFDGYHEYAVDIHSIRCVYHLENIKDPLIQDLFEQLNTDEKAMLKLVTFLHDAGKGRKRDHHNVGVSLFRVFATKLHMNEELITLGERLIRYHTLMSIVAQREDIYNEKVILKFAAHFPNQKLLDMIYVLTYADMSGVGENIYNSFNAKLIRSLYKKSIEVLNHTAMLDETSKRTKKEASVKKNKSFLALNRSEQKKILQIPSNLIFLRYTPQHIIDIAKNALETKEFTYKINHKANLTIEIICSKAFNISYFFAKLSTLDVGNMDICKLFDGLKYYRIDFSDHIDDDEIFLIEEIINNSFDTSIKHKVLKPQINKNEIIIDCEHSKTYAQMSLRCKNQKGLLAFIIEMFHQMDIDIETAKIHTLKNRVRDMFLIQKNGNFCQNVDTIIEKLTGEM